MVVDTHECTERWEDEHHGTKGWETTRCEVADGAMTVSVSGGSDMSGVPVMSLGPDAVEDWFKEE
jgi:hypothetical protein